MRLAVVDDSGRRSRSPGIGKKSGSILDREISMITREQVQEKLREVFDPEIGINIVDLGLVYDIIIAAENHITINMTLTSPGCPIAPILMAQAEEAVKKIPELKQVSVNLVWEPPWNPETMASDTAKDQLGIWKNNQPTIFRPPSTTINCPQIIIA